MHLFTKYLFFFLEYFSTVLLSLSAFRIQIRYSLIKIAAVTLTMVIVSIYIRDFMQQSTFALIPTLAVEIVFLTILFRFPILFSFLMALIGTLAGATLELASGWIISNLNILTLEDLQANAIPIQITTIILNMIIIIYIQRRKIGFHFTTRDSLRGYNFYLSAALIVAVILLQYQIYTVEKNIVNSSILFFSAIIFLTCIYLSYRHNKNLWKERRERLEKK